MTSVLILTHRRGAFVVFSKTSFLQQDNVKKLSDCLIELLHQMKNVKDLSHFQKSTIGKFHFHKDQETEVFSHSDFSLVRTLGKTAENLSLCYERGLKALDSVDKDIQEITLGLGPGSFTGLRLGAAFCNGLCFGKKRERLIGVKTPMVSNLSLLINEMDAQELFQRELGEHYEASDDSSGSITFFDLLYILNYEFSEKLKDKSQFLFVKDKFEPLYGREPGPVLELRKRLGLL